MVTMSSLPVLVICILASLVLIGSAISWADHKTNDTKGLPRSDRPSADVEGLFNPRRPVSEFGGQQGASGEPRGGSFRDRFPHSRVADEEGNELSINISPTQMRRHGKRVSVNFRMVEELKVKVVASDGGVAHCNEVIGGRPLTLKDECFPERYKPGQVYEIQFWAKSKLIGAENG